MTNDNDEVPKGTCELYSERGYIPTDYQIQLDKTYRRHQAVTSIHFIIFIILVTIVVFFS